MRYDSGLIWQLLEVLPTISKFWLFRIILRMGGKKNHMRVKGGKTKEGAEDGENMKDRRT
jgi:hypothetical protein